jgi:hypothetical protein
LDKKREMSRVYKKIFVEKKRDSIHTLISAFILILFSLMLLYRVWPEIYSPPPSKEAIKLKLVVPSMISTYRETNMKLYAVNEVGQIDITRNDTIKLLLSDTFCVELSTSKVTLENGEATIGIIGKTSKSVIIIATWISGENYLEPAKIMISFMTT